MCGTPHRSRMTSTASRRPGTDVSPSIFDSDWRASAFRSPAAGGAGAGAPEYAVNPRIAAPASRAIAWIRITPLPSFTDHLNHDFPLARPRVELDQRHLLPRAHEQLAVGERNRQRGPDQRGADVARPVVVSPPQVVTIVGVARRNRLEQTVQVGDGARLEFDGRHRRGRANDEDCSDPGRAGGFRDGSRYKLGDVVRVALAASRHVAPIGRHHSPVAYRLAVRLQGGRSLREDEMGLRDKYSNAILTAKNLHMQGSADERDGKLYFHGTVPSQAEVNKIWDAIKTVPDWQKEIVGDIRATGAAEVGTAGSAATYTVKAGDTLSKIAKT